MNSRALLLGIFVVLTIILASLSAVEYLRTSQLNAQLSPVEGAPSSLGQVGQIVIVGEGTFDFRAANYTTPNTFTFENVTFTSTPTVSTGAVCAEFNATLQDGSSYSLAACAFDVFLQNGQSSGSVGQMVLSFTTQATPQAGVMLLPNRSAYVLVRASS